ncbi:MAG TPA: flagellin [Xanthobacteraceae bacterium]|nr:flagellin [Xanthobacteraceae bacterium]
MASDIVLSAGVRQNLLALQNTAQLMSVTQHRLATGKRVNSALDSPSNFFTSQSLSSRANDLSALLDAISQAQKTLEAADQGITSLIKLVESAKSVAKQARQIAEPQVTYGTIDTTGDVDFSETLATHTGTANVTVANNTAYSFDISINGGPPRTVTYTSDADATYSEILAGLQASLATELAAAGYAGRVTLSQGPGTTLKLDAADTDVDFTIANASAETNLVDGAYTSSNLLDLSPGLAGKFITVQANGGTPKTIIFGNAGDQVSTFAELQAALAGTGVTAALTPNGAAKNLTLSVASTTGTQNALVLSGTALGSGAGTLGIAAATLNGAPIAPTPDPTRANYQSQYNEILTQIDALTKDSVYNGINLLAGDQLKVVFNERGTSSITIMGVKFDSINLGLNQITGTGFQANVNIDATLEQIDAALVTLRTQASNFGATLTTVQTRQDFIRNLTIILRSGSDELVLADTNEEGANMLALQTRQQLSTTALSLSAQADQAVLRLFG